MRAMDAWYTLGHSRHPWDRFADLLTAHGVKRVADVRSVPRSRFSPHFNQKELVRRLAELGIAYVHLPELGGKRQAPPRTHNPGLAVEAQRTFADLLPTDESARGLEALLELGPAPRTALLCSEGDFHQCHRMVLSDVLAVRGFEVRHILPDGGLETHVLRPGIEVEGGLPTYP